MEQFKHHLSAVGHLTHYMVKLTAHYGHLPMDSVITMIQSQIDINNM